MTLNMRHDAGPRLVTSLQLVSMGLLLLITGSLAITIPTLDAGLVRSPPRLVTQSDREVWFDIPISGAPHKFVLDCYAEGDPERYIWFKNGIRFEVDGDRVIYKKPGQSGTIVFLRPRPTDSGYYQCHVLNIFGVALSNIFTVKMGVLDHFQKKERSIVDATVGDNFTMKCDKPHGVPEPSVFWLYRSSKKSSVIETIDEPHITVDGDGNLQFSYVRSHDGREDLFYQCAATSPVLNGEYRTGNEYTLNAIEVKNGPNPKPPAKLWFTPTHVQFTAGFDIRLTCIFSGFPLPVVSWWKVNEDLPTERMLRKNHGKTLVINRALPEDAGVYVCQAGEVEHKMTVSITTSPFWISSPPKDVNVLEDKDTELVCDATGTPLPIFRWFMNGKPLEGELVNERRRVIDSGKRLVISSLNHDIDTGVYQCNASNYLGYVFANAFINVLAHAPRFTTPVEQVIKVIVSTTVFLDCAAEAAPEPTFQWVDEHNKRISDIEGKLEILQNRTIRITDVRLEDSMIFYCNVTNKYGQNRAKRTLEVYKPSYFLKVLPKEQQKLQAFDSLELECSVQADERLGITYTWWREQTLLNIVENEHFSLVKPNHLRLSKLRGHHSGSYRCVATTDVDQIESKTAVIVEDVPEPPEIVDVECNERRALIKWKHAFNNFNAIKRYVLEFSTAFHPGEWRVALTEDKVDMDRFEALVTLSPWVNYTFRVIAHNEKGAGNPGYKIGAICNTPPSVPYDNPTNVTAEGSTKDNLVIYWQPLDKEDWNGGEFKYLIRHKLDEPGARWHEFYVEDPLQDRVTIRDRPTFKKYAVQVRSVNSMGPSILEPTTKTGFSGEDYPFEGPENFEIKKIYNWTSVEFEWDHVSRNSINGFFRGYKIQIWVQEAPFARRNKRAAVLRVPSGDFDEEVMVPPTENNAVLHEFSPMGKYLARVLAFNSRYNGPASPLMAFTMPEGIPSEVVNLEAISAGANTILVTWSPPDTPNGKIRGYFLLFSTLDQPDRPPEETFVVFRQTNYVHNAAIANNMYSIQVWAQTGGGEGPRSLVTTKTWPKSQVPGKPHILLVNKEAGGARFRWLPPEGAMSGSSFYLNYTVFERDLYHYTRSVLLPEREASLHGLLADTEYSVFLVAVDGNRTHSSDMLTFRTLKPEQDVDAVTAAGITGAAWFIAILCALSIALISVIVVCICQRSKGGKYPVKKKEMERGHCLDNDEEKSFIEYQYGSQFSSKDGSQ